jgi:two-component system, chemotaxis family, response regulator Rcp1
MENQPGHRSIEILLVEDNPGDIRLAKEALEESKLRNNLNIVMDGIEAIKYLRQEDNYLNVSVPDLILLDLNLPKKNGEEVLREIKNDDMLKYIPVVVLTSSKADEDIFKAYNLHANCFITKPVDFMQFIKVVKSIEEFWFTIVKLPNRNNSDGKN